MSRYLTGLTCIRCGSGFPPDVLLEGCPVCRRPDSGANLTPTYDWSALKRTVTRESLQSGIRSMWRFDPLFPVSSAQAVTLNEGMTPLIELPQVAQELKLGKFYVKDDTRNPTGSYKDRLCSLAVSHARQSGARVVTASSSGNHGASAAAYAARAGLDCVIFATSAVGLAHRRAIQSYGATLVAVSNREDRWLLLEQAVRQWDWYPVSNHARPAVGSNPFGIEGYKSIAYEIAMDLEFLAPSAVVVPTCYGDGLFGIWKGFDELYRLGLIDRVPAMIAAEVQGSIFQAMRAGYDFVPEVEMRATLAVSIQGPQSNYQSLHALRASGGLAVHIREDDRLVYWQRELGRAGILAELSAAAGMAAAADLADHRVLKETDMVVALVTAHGYKDQEILDGNGPAPPVTEPTLDALAAVLPHSLLINR